MVSTLDMGFGRVTYDWALQRAPKEKAPEVMRKVAP